MRASIVIAAHNEGESLQKTVAAIVQSSVGLDYEIDVADDASGDGSVEEMRRRFPQVRVVRHPQRRGASPTKDLGARAAGGEVLVFLDGHTNPQPGAILQLVEDVERLEGRAIITPTVEALDVGRWKNSTSQVGHGYRLDLEQFDCGWLPLGQLRQVRHKGRTFHESPALIGCALAVHRNLYDELGGFDPEMRFWGVEDLDFGLKCWLMGFSILHDAEAVVGHRFRESFDNYDVPIEHLVANQLRMARKSFTHTVWSEWVDRCRRRHSGRLTDHPEGLWARVWNLFEADRPSVEEQRAHLQGRRQRDEFWYAERFGLTWPRLEVVPLAPMEMAFEAMAAEPSASPSPPPSICSETNLIANPGCELPPVGGSPTPPNWTQLSGNWQRQQGGVDLFPLAHEGSYLFWTGNTQGEGELYQDVDVSAEATRIDAGNVEFSFSACLNTYRSDGDTSRVILEYRDGGGAVIESYDSGAQNVDHWMEFTDVRVAPSGTRTIRVRLIANWASGEANDGYFDNLSLVARCGMCSAMNLIRNPGCELPGEPPPYWTEVSGDWKRQQGGVDSFPPARGGKYLFWAGKTASGELYQDVDVSDKATEIDNGEIRLRFSGWLNTYGEGDTDTSRMIVEYRQADDTVLASYDTGAQNVDEWTNYTDARIAPSGTRKVRIRLLAVRHIPTDNDGYFDELSLVAECDVCGATLRFLDNTNIEIFPESRALGVSNYVTDNLLPPNSAFDAGTADPNNFRLEVEDDQAEGPSVDVTLTVGNRTPITYTLDKKSGVTYQGEFLRLVTDGFDDQVQGTQTVLCKLGEQVVLSYTRAGATCADERRIGIGRPVGEDYNGGDQLKHDIREVKLNIVVFSVPAETALDGMIIPSQTTIKVDSVADFQPAGKLRIRTEIIEYRSINLATNEITALKADGSSGRGAESTSAHWHPDGSEVFYSTTTPTVTRDRVLDDLNITDQRYAQCGVRIKRPVSIDIGGSGDPGKPNHPDMIEKHTPEDETILACEVSKGLAQWATLTDAEKQLVMFKDADLNSVDVFYLHKVYRPEDGGRPGGGAYIACNNDTGDNAYQNLFFIAANQKPGSNPPWPDAISFAHELLHVLLDKGHRTDPGNADPVEALFHGSAPNSLQIGGPKRIGPFATDTDGAGDADTTKVRNSASQLP